VIDLMAALRASVERSRAARGESTAKPAVAEDPKPAAKKPAAKKVEDKRKDGADKA